MTQIPDKPFKSFPELVSLLENTHKLKISDPETAEKILSLIPYYDLINGYKDLFMDNNDEYISSVTFEDLYLFHIFDKGFQGTIFPFSNIIENYFKNVLAYVIAKDFGVCEKSYLHKSNYIGNIQKRYYSDIQSSIEKVYNDTRIDEPTAYYLAHHNHIPPWILLKNVTFSRAINLFEFLKPAQRIQVCDMLIPASIPQNQKYQLLLYVLTVIRKCRNTIAHNLKFTSFSVSQYNKHLPHRALRTFISPKLLSWEEIRKEKNIDDIYAYIMFSLSLIPDSAVKLFFLQQLIDYLTANSLRYTESSAPNLANLYIKKLNFPPDIVSRLQNYRNSVSK